MKVFVFTINQAFDGEIENSLAVYKSKDDAVKALEEWKKDEMQYVERDGWTIGEDTETSFEAFEEGYYATNHDYACITECDVQ